MVNNHDSDDTLLTATTLGKWQSEDVTIRDVIAGHRWDGPTRNIGAQNRESTNIFSPTASYACNEQTCYPPAVLVLGRECKIPGNWALSKSTPVHIEKLKEESVEREKYILDKKVVVKPSSNTGTPVRFGKGDVVYYKANHLLKILIPFQNLVNQIKNKEKS
ncbi:hypothetical protein QTP88_023770 [Uroleucon formosanum]